MVSKLTSTAFLLLQIPVEVFYLRQFVIFIAMFLSPDHIPNRLPTRIVSLVPSQTELLYDLGLRDEVIGITKFCIHPAEWHRNKLRVGGTKDVDIEKIKAINPDLILANKEENVKEQMEALALHFPVLVTDVNNYEDALQMIQDVSRQVDRTREAADLVHNIGHAFMQRPHNSTAIPACYLIWKDPYMTVGQDTFINDMMRHAGFANVFAGQVRYPIIRVEEISNSGCKVILLSSEPYPFKEKHLSALRDLLPGIDIVLVDGEMFSWYGSRLLLAPAYFNELQQNLQRNRR